MSNGGVGGTVPSEADEGIVPSEKNSARSEWGRRVRRGPSREGVTDGSTWTKTCAVSSSIGRAKVSVKNHQAKRCWKRTRYSDLGHFGRREEKRRK